MRPRGQSEWDGCNTILGTSFVFLEFLGISFKNGSNSCTHCIVCFQQDVPSNKRHKISDSPHGCDSIDNQRRNNGYVGVSNHNFYHKPKEDKSVDFLLKKGGFNIVPRGDFGSGRFISAKKKFHPSCGSKVKPLSLEETIEPMASQGRRKHHSDSSGDIQRKHLPVQK